MRIAEHRIVPGDLLVVMGFPLGGPFTTGRGRVVDLRRDGHGGKVIEASVDVLPGTSGGPLLDTKGRLVGIVRAIDLENGSALGIPKDAVEKLLRGEGTFAGQPCEED